MTPEERRWYINNQTEYVKRWMMEHDEEVKIKKLVDFVNGKDDMNTTDLKEAVSTLHSIARLIESRIGKGTLSDSLRDIADKLNSIIKRK